ncbi:protein kinase [Beggiatoa leptomitoformis]|uniref:XRE family transcriptional regulator n=1 Tax=Beggiatoa leptomitoformis TaxID=288004 RepID=A0A2N9YAI5_9GAMM|nr:protein kinase [Beggiatoa leptomitoformis]ALG67146.1 XRE family transcriptional regulator [Beggiatoa leptomitoformis]AUI67454.1 XRE family transcriptional regulator [Beggiatoa leptomitoformis]
MSYLLKHIDKPLLRFKMTIDPIQGLSITIQDNYLEYKQFLPLDLEVSSTGILQWLKRRVIPKNRAFVQQFLSKQGLSIQDTKGIIDTCKGLSLNDCYWVIDDNFKKTFDEYNLYEHHFSQILALIAYTGYGESIHRRFVSSPELTTDGMLAKCWRRINGKIVLYKAGSTGAANTGNEPYSEYYAAQIAQTMGLDAITYNLSHWKGKLCSTCQLFTNKEQGYIPIGRLITTGGWATVLNYYQQLGTDYYQSLLDMLIFDAVICNEDRHFGNFGLLINNHTNQIIKPAPIFDNGLSLFNYAMDDDLENIDTYAKTRSMATGQDFITFAQAIITKQQKEKLRALINFKFKKHTRYNLSSNRLKILESFIQQRVKMLLALHINKL